MQGLNALSSAKLGYGQYSNSSNSMANSFSKALTLPQTYSHLNGVSPIHFRTGYFSKKQEEEVERHMQMRPKVRYEELIENYARHIFPSNEGLSIPKQIFIRDSFSTVLQHNTLSHQFEKQHYLFVAYSNSSLKQLLRINKDGKSFDKVLEFIDESVQISRAHLLLDRYLVVIQNETNLAAFDIKGKDPKKQLCRYQNEGLCGMKFIKLRKQFFMTISLKFQLFQFNPPGLHSQSPSIKLKKEILDSRNQITSSKYKVVKDQCSGPYKQVLLVDYAQGDILEESKVPNLTGGVNRRSADARGVKKSIYTIRVNFKHKRIKRMSEVLKGYKIYDIFKVPGIRHTYMAIVLGTQIKVIMLNLKRKSYYELSWLQGTDRIRRIPQLTHAKNYPFYLNWNVDTGGDFYMRHLWTQQIVYKFRNRKVDGLTSKNSSVKGVEMVGSDEEGVLMVTQHLDSILLQRLNYCYDDL